MELTYLLVLAIVGFVTASPYGYGTKGGSATKAEGSAVAGAYTSAGNVPLNIPTGAGYSGSFSQSSSSSSSSSSASASSSSFSYNGSGAVSGGIPGANGCGSGNCNGGGAVGSQGSAAAGSQTYSGAGALTGGYGGTVPTNSYGHKYSSTGSQLNKAQDCGSEGCQKPNDSGSLNGNKADIGIQSASNAAAGANLLASSVCGDSGCNNVADTKCPSGQCGSNVKCSSGNCGVASHTDYPTQQNESGVKCTAGKCDQNQDTQGGSSTIVYGTNDIHVPTFGTINRKSSYGASESGCANGNCDLPSASGSELAPGYNKPATELTAPKLEPACSGSNCYKSPSDYSSNTFGNPTSDGKNPSCNGGECGSSISSLTKVPYTSSQNGNKINQTPSPGYGGYPKFPIASSSNGDNTAGLPSTPSVSGAVPGIGLPLYTGNFGVAAGASAQKDAKDNLPVYTGGFGGPAGVLKPNEFSATTSNYGNIPATNKPASPNLGGFSKPSYSHGSSPHSSVKPSVQACAPGTPGCIIAPSSSPSDCASGNCGTNPSAPGYGSPSSVKPSYSFGSSPSYSPINPSGIACTPGTPGCSTSSSASRPSSCASGNCGALPQSIGYDGSSSIKPSYSHDSSASYSPAKPLGSTCAPGNPGCDLVLSVDAPDCASGNCAHPTASGYGGSSNIKPTYGNAPSFPIKPQSLTCTPGTPGCAPSPSASAPSVCATGNCGVYPTPPGYGGSTVIKPSYSHGSSPSYSPVNTLGPNCTPGTPGCAPSPSASGPSGCATGNCDAYPTPPGYGGSAAIKPSYSHGSSPSYSPVNPLGPTCTPGTPGCALSPSASAPSGCATGNCGAYPTSSGYGGSTAIKPSHSHESSPSYSPVNPFGQTCTPGTPGCAPSLSASAPSGCATGNCGAYPTSPGYGGSTAIKPSYSHDSSPSYSPVNPSGPTCTPGTPGCSPSSSASASSGCVTGNCGAYPTSPGYVGSTAIKPSYSHGSSPTYSPVNPLAPTCTPGTPGCAPSPSASAPSDCATGNCGAYPTSPDYGYSSPQSCIPGTPGCSGSSPTTHSGSSGHSSSHSVSGAPAYTALSPFPISQTSTGNNGPSYGASGAGSFLNQGSYGSHGIGSIQTSETPASGVVPVVGSPSYTHNVGNTAGADAYQGTKENLPAYTGGFGGPAGILKPNGLSATSSYGSKPAISSPSIAKPACTSGNCDAQASPTHSHSGSASGAQATAAGSASADAIAYTGGFGGPPGFLKPYDSGKINANELAGKHVQGSLLDVNSGNSGSGIHSSYSNSGSQNKGNAISQAIGTAFSTTGVSGTDNKLHGGYSSGHEGAGDCPGGCGGSGGGNLGYSGALGFSKTGVSGESSNGLATAGAVSKSVASASSGARAYGSSYASSSASAHSGASIKGGYGRR